MSSEKLNCNVKTLKGYKENLYFQDISLNESDSNTNSFLSDNLNNNDILLSNSISNKLSPRKLKYINNNFANMNNNNFNYLINSEISNFNKNNFHDNRIEKAIYDNNEYDYNEYFNNGKRNNKSSSDSNKYKNNFTKLIKNNFFENHKTPFKNLIKDLNSIPKETSFLFPNNNNNTLKLTKSESFTKTTNDLMIINNNKTNTTPNYNFSNSMNLFPSIAINSNAILNSNSENNNNINTSVNCGSSCNSNLSNNAVNNFINLSSKPSSANNLKTSELNASILENLLKLSSKSNSNLTDINSLNCDKASANNYNSKSSFTSSYILNTNTNNNNYNNSSALSKKPSLLQSPVKIKNKIIIVDNKSESERKENLKKSFKETKTTTTAMTTTNNNNNNKINKNINMENNLALPHSKSASGKKRIFECTEECSSTFNTTQKKNKIKKRFRKSSDQLKFLFETYKSNNENWSKDLIAEVSLKTGLSENKVYKWFWDQKNKEILEKKQGCIFQVRNMHNAGVGNN